MTAAPAPNERAPPEQSLGSRGGWPLRGEDGEKASCSLDCGARTRGTDGSEPDHGSRRLRDRRRGSENTPCWAGGALGF